MIAKIFRLLILFILFAGIAVVSLGYQQYNHSITHHLQPTEQDIISVRAGDTLGTIAAELAQKHDLPNPWAVKIYAKLHPEIQKIQAGDYRIHANSTVLDLLADMVAGRVIVFEFRLVEGKTFAEMMHLLAQSPELTHTLNGKSRKEIAQILGIEGDPEGWFYPDTYRYTRHSSDQELLQRLHQNMRAVLQEHWQDRDDRLPLKTPYEALILASIIEKETGVADERAQVAGVFVRRLQKKMRLQTDPSVIYGMNHYQGTITRQDLQKDTPYNTYTRLGLPPTPIAMPSEASIYAALHPDEGDALYFVADGKGGHIFSATYEAHLKAVQRYRRSQNHAR